MATIRPNLFHINGVISSNKTAIQNMNDLCTAAGAWMTYDIAEGKWSVIINQTGSSVASFDDNNIIGGINVSGSGINELYNSATIEFPHRDLKDQTDYIDLEIPAEDRFPNELDNNLLIRTDLVNDPIQAAYLAAIELKQSRVDKVIEFRTDYSKIGLKAGDIIDVTNSVYDYTSKLFRITRMVEEDTDDGNIVIGITALEYDADVYSTAGLIRKTRSKKTGIVPKAANNALKDLDTQSGLKLELTDTAKFLGASLFFVPNAGAAGYDAGTYYLDFAGQKAQIAASDVVIEWTFQDGTDLDIRARVVSPDVGQSTIDDYLGYTGINSLYVWPIGSSGGSSGTAYIEWGGDNQGTGTETIRVDIDRLQAAYPNKRYFAIECRGNWYVSRGSQPVLLVATLYEGGTTTRQENPAGSGSGGFGFTNTGATRARVLNGVGVYVDSLAGAGPGEPGASAPGDLMGYFVYDTVTQEGQFLQQLPPGISD